MRLYSVNAYLYDLHCYPYILGNSMEEKDIRRHLKTFTSTFCFDKTHLKKQNVKEIAKKLKKDYEASNKDNEEKIWINNFLSFLFHLLVKTDASLEYCEQSLKFDPKNITANSNKCHILLDKDDICDARNVLVLLQEIEQGPDFIDRTYDAKADLAYAYSRAGPHYLDRAEDIYNAIIPIYPTKYQWKFGFGLTLIRQTHFANPFAKNVFQHEGNTLSKALDFFSDIAVHTEGSDKVLCALSWTQIGAILYGNKKSKYSKGIKLSRSLQNVKPLECFHKALSICSDDPFVLEQCGKYYRYFVNISKSEELLRKAIQIRETVFAYHHLALTLKRKVEKKSFDHKDVQKGQSKHFVEVLFKSPSEMQIYPKNETLLEALGFIRKALEISSTPRILYELALLFRLLDQPEKALETLNEITSERKSDMSWISLVNVYEQKGMCFIDLGKKTDSLEEKSKFKENAKSVLFKAIELQAKLIREDKMLRNVWHSYPTLKYLLESDTDKASKSKLAKIHSMMNEHDEAIDLLKRLKEQNDGVLEVDQYKDLVESYLEI